MANERLEGGLVNVFSFVDVDRAASALIKRLWLRRPLRDRNDTARSAESVDTLEKAMDGLIDISIKC